MTAPLDQVIRYRVCLLRTCCDGLGVDERGLVGAKVRGEGRGVVERGLVGAKAKARVGSGPPPLDQAAERLGAGDGLGDARGTPARLHPQGADDISARAGFLKNKKGDKRLRTSEGAMPREGSSKITWRTWHP